MKKGGGKSKGNAFERKVAKLFSLWLTNDQDDKQLIRSVSSGGWQSNVGDGDWRQVGDWAPNGPAGEEFRRVFGVELKHRSNLDWWCVFTQTADEDRNITGFWEKLCNECDEASVVLLPLLIVRFTGRPILIGMPHQLADHVPGGGSCLKLDWGADASSGEYMPPSGDGGWGASFVLLTDFLAERPLTYYRVARRILPR